MGAYISDNDLKDIEKTLFKTKINSPNVYYYIFTIIILVFIYLLY